MSSPARPAKRDKHLVRHVGDIIYQADAQGRFTWSRSDRFDHPRLRDGVVGRDFWT